MAISVQDGELVVRPGGQGGYEDASMYIRSLLNLLMSVDDRSSRFQTEDLYYVCDLIGELLPSHEEFYRMEQLKVSEK